MPRLAVLGVLLGLDIVREAARRGDAVATAQHDLGDVLVADLADLDQGAVGGPLGRSAAPGRAMQLLVADGHELAQRQRRLDAAVRAAVVALAELPELRGFDPVQLDDARRRPRAYRRRSRSAPGRRPAPCEDTVAAQPATRMVRMASRRPGPPGIASSQIAPSRVCIVIADPARAAARSVPSIASPVPRPDLPVFRLPRHNINGPPRPARAARTGPAAAARERTMGRVRAQVGARPRPGLTGRGDPLDFSTCST